MRVLILGGGITGLVTAYRLLAAGAGVEVSLHEGAERAGGNMGSEAAGGFIWERGPNGFTDGSPATVDLARDLGLGERLLGSSPLAKKRYVLKGGKLQAVPGKPLGLLFSGLLSFRGKMRLLSEPLRGPPRSEVEESLAAFGRRRLGREATRTFLDPIATGVYAGDVERLSATAAFPSLARLESEHGSLFRGLVARARGRARAPAGGRRPAAGGGPRPGSATYSFPGGLQELVDALVDRLEGRIRLRSPAEAVRRRGDGYEVLFRDRRAEAARAVVIALPAPRAAHLFSASNADLANALEEIPYAPVAVVCLGWRREDVAHPLDGFGFLIPRDQDRRSLGAIWTSSIFPPHAPPGFVNLRVLLGGTRDPEVVGLADDVILATVLRELEGLLGLKGEPAARRIYRYPQGIPQYNVGHARRLSRIDAWIERLPGLSLTGNAYRGVGINDCVEEGGRVAQAVLAYLGAGKRVEGKTAS